jgi:hypothetical protein
MDQATWNNLNPYQQEALLNSGGTYTAASGYAQLVPGAVQTQDVLGNTVYMSPGQASGTYIAPKLDTTKYVQTAPSTYMLRSQLPIDHPASTAPGSPAGTVQAGGVPESVLPSGPPADPNSLVYLAIGLVAVVILFRR